jgi:hypothetical protein
MKVSSLLGGVAAVVVVASSSLAQAKSAIGHGSWLVGGTADLAHSNAGGNSTTAATFQPFGLYFVADHLGIGGTLSLGHVSTDAGATESHDTAIGAEPTIRYFFGDLAGKLFPYLNAAIGPSWDKLKFEGNGSTSGEETTTAVEFTGSAGVMRLLASHVGLTGEVYYTHRHRSSDVGNATLKANSDNYGLRFGFNAFVF